MSSLSPVGQSPAQVSGVEPMTMMSAPPVAYLQGTLSGVANMLSLPMSDLQSRLRQGASISDVAAKRGVSSDSIVQYIEQQVQQQRAAQGKPPVDPQTLDQVVNAAVNRHRHGHHHHGKGAVGAAATDPQQVGAPPPDGSSSLDLLA